MKILGCAPIYNEEIMLPHFLSHYRKLCDRIILWDNGSTDHSPKIAAEFKEVEVRPFETDGYDEAAILGLLTRTKIEAKGEFDWILLLDCDEFIIGNLKEVVETAKSDVLAPLGFSLVQAPWEDRLDPSRPPLDQRSFGWRSVRYSKPILMRPRAKIELRPGRHDVLSDNYEVAWSPDIALVHAEMIDFDLWRYRKNRRPLSESTRKAGYCVDRFCKSETEHHAQWVNAVAISKDLTLDLDKFRGV
jgi:glycosyltransferase involved in cell wall biosynthesis